MRLVQVNRWNRYQVDNDADDDGVCDADEIAGCQDATACNYNRTPLILIMILVYLQQDGNLFRLMEQVL